MKRFIKEDNNSKLPMTNDLDGVGVQSKDVVGELSPDDFYSGSKSKKLVVHFMVSENKEVGKPKKIPLSKQEIEYKKKVWPVNRKSIITDSKGIPHLYVDINKERSYSFNKSVTDTCKKCGGQLAIDSRNVRDLVKRKTIETFWGVDSTHIMLLLIMGIVLLAMIAIVFYMYTENTKLNTKLQTFLPATDKSSSVTGKFMLGVLTYQ